MNVLHLANTPLSGAPYRLSEVLREGGINSRLISHRNYYSSSSPVFYDSDIILNDDQFRRKNTRTLSYDRDEVLNLFREADVIHLHNYVESQFLFRLYPFLKEELKKKKVIFQVHSPRSSLPEISKIIKDKSIHEKLVVAQYHVRQYPEFTVVPNVVPINNPLFMPMERDNEIPLIAYSPSNTNLKDWNNKGYPEVRAALSKCKSKHEFMTITSTPNRKCLQMKRKADIALEEIMTGSYHMCALEALSMGQCLIANIDDKCKDAIRMITGGAVFPHMSANKDNLHEIIDLCASNDLTSIKKQSRLFMETFWNPQLITEKFREIYER